VIIVLASSADMFAGNEIDRAQVRQFIALLTSIAMTANSAVVLISHPSLTGLQTRTGLSGSTAWHNSTRARMVLESVEKRDEPTGDMRTLEFAKNNYGPVSAKIAVRWQNGVFVPVDVSANRAERAQVMEDLYIEIAGILINQGENLSANKTAANYAAAMIYDHPKGKEFIGKQEVEAVQQRLLAANKIHIKTDGPASKPQRRIALGPKQGEPEEPL